MTDEEFEKIITSLNAQGFAKAMTDIQIACMQKLALLATMHKLDTCDVYRAFGASMLRIADEIDRGFCTSEDDDDET